MRPQHAGQPAESAGDDEGDIFVQPNIVAEHGHAQLALADSLQAASERRAHQHVHQNHRHDEKAEHEKEERHVVRQVETETRPRFDDEAVVAAGDRIPAIGESPDALPERQRDHHEIDAGSADGE